MRNKWTIEQKLHAQNERANRAGARHDLTMKQWLETKVIRFIESKGVKIRFHIHKYNVPGLSINDAQAYINQFFVNTGYAFIE